MIWVVFTAMFLLAAAALLLPLYGARGSGAERAARQGDEALEVYRQQLEELERDLLLGLLNADEGEAARLEIHRRMLEVSSEAGGGDGAGLSPKLATALALLVLAAATAFYAERGRPGLVSLPLDRDADAAQQFQLPPAMGKIEDRLAQLEAKLLDEPDNLEGWSMLARSYSVLGRTADAANAYGRAVALAPDDVELRLAQAELLVDVLEGLVGPAAKLAFNEIHQLDPGHPAPRFYLGLAEQQNKNSRGALEIWQDLEADSPADAPWLPALRERIAAVQADLGIGE
jgi:cytochrome c-type biogenesis protein CcmH